MRSKKHVVVYSPSRSFLMLSHIAFLLRLGPYKVTTASTEDEALAAEEPRAVLMLCPECTEEDERMVLNIKDAFPDATVILTTYAHKLRPTAADTICFGFDSRQIREKVRLAVQCRRGPKKRAS